MNPSSEPRPLSSDPNITDSQALYHVAQVLLSQVVNLLRTTVTTDQQLSTTSFLIPGSTIGKHLRHVHDHFRLLLSSLPPSPNSTPLILSYDTRSRNVLSETSHTAALESFLDLKSRLERETGRGSVDCAQRVRLEAVTPVVVELESSWGRELWFTCLHAIHHYSLLRVIAVGELHLTVPPDFGVAPSTLAFRSWESVSSESPKLKL